MTDLLDSDVTNLYIRGWLIYSATYDWFVHQKRDFSWNQNIIVVGENRNFTTIYSNHNLIFLVSTVIVIPERSGSNILNCHNSFGLWGEGISIGLWGEGSSQRKSLTDSLINTTEKTQTLTFQQQQQQIKWMFHAQNTQAMSFFIIYSCDVHEIFIFRDIWLNISVQVF